MTARSKKLVKVGQRPKLAELLIELREKHRFSIRSLADESDVSRNYISQIESGYDPRTGKPIKPHPDILKRLGQVLGGSYDALMLAAGYLPEEVAASVMEQEIRPMPQRQALPPEVVDELKDRMTDAMMEVLRKRGYIK